MTELLIQYCDGSGNVSERKISKVELQDSAYILAYCHHREEDRTFKISRIVSAVDLSTGEVIEDLFAYFGAPRPAPTINPYESAPTDPDTPKTADWIKRQRNKEKYELFRVFVYPVIAEHAKRKLFHLFGDCCFKCGAGAELEIDHHVPIVLGGHLVPGNLVALCKRCNNRKSDLLPSAFYSKDELERVQHFLAAQHEIFAFDFDMKRWRADREAYLLSLGLDADLVREVLHNPDHRFYIEPEREFEGVVFSVDEETILRITQEVLADMRSEE